MEKKNKILQIGTLAISALGIISLSDSKINNLKPEENFKLINSSFADDDNDDDNENKIYYKKKKTKIVKNTASTSTSTSNKATTNNISINPVISQTGATCKTVYDTSYKTVYDTVTSASGTPSQIPRQVAVQVPRQVCDNSVNTTNQNFSLTNTGNILSTILSDTGTISSPETTSKLFKAPNKKIYSIIDDGTSVKIKKGDGTYAAKTFSTYYDAVAYLNQNAIPASEVYKAPNGKNYTIMYENGKIVVKKSDWSYASKTFASYSEAKTYLNVNAPKQVVIVKPIIKKTVAKVSTVKKTTALNTKVTKTVIKKPVVTATKPVVTKPVVSTPKVDTTTKAS
ncbi:MAG: hypothetical protein PHG82_02860 [Candidatus Gracilibacteria bacterium]|nr:hypothetical protein [Candidatus Gracilibacteria bacterium]